MSNEDGFNENGGDLPKRRPMGMDGVRGRVREQKNPQENRVVINKGAKYPRGLTSYDFLKIFALITLAIDYAGYYLYPDIEWFRVFGAMSVPIWFFLIGFAKSRDLSEPIWYCAFLLLWFDFMCGLSVFPFNVLCTIIVLRMIIDWLGEKMFGSVEAKFYIIFAILLFGVPLGLFFEYMGAAILFALVGYMVRNKYEIEPSRFFYVLLPLVAWLFYVGVIYISQSNFEAEHMVIASFGVGLVVFWLCNFRRVQYKSLTKALPSFFVILIQFFGRETLYIYTAYVIALSLAVVFLKDPRFGWFKFEWFMPY